jgi:hypothetical protein
MELFPNCVVIEKVVIRPFYHRSQRNEVSPLGKVPHTWRDAATNRFPDREYPSSRHSAVYFAIYAFSGGPLFNGSGKKSPRLIDQYFLADEGRPSKTSGG